MPVRYSRQQSKVGASIGTIIPIPKPGSWTNSSNENTESLNWNIEEDYPGWFECDGRTLDANDYRDLYQILGNTYGGIPGSTFVLPDYRSKKLMGTGTVNSNSGVAPSLTPVSAPAGLSPSINVPGSEGGIFTVSTVRQLPPGSEITPSAPEKPDVFFDVNGPVLGVNPTFTSGTAYQNYGTGVTEIGGFAEPVIPNGGRYIAFGTIGTSPFNTTQYTREVRYNNLDLSGYSAVRIYSIAGNDANGGERVNDAGEGLRVIWPNGSESVILPSAGDPGYDLETFDEEFTAWRELQVDIPFQYRVPGVTIRFRQDVDPSTNNPPGTEQQASVPIGSNPNAFDMIGIARVGFLGGNIGGDAEDTFTLGTFRTTGFDGVTGVANVNFSGNASFSIGPTSQNLIPGAPPHFHEWAYTKVNPQQFSLGSPTYNRDGGEPVFPLYSPTVGTVVTYDRRGRNLRRHSHMLSFNISSLSSRQTIGNGEGSGDLANSVVVGGNTSNQEYSTDANIGNVISRTIDAVNEMGINANIGDVGLTSSSRIGFDNALSVRLQSAETIPLMSPYFRVKYIIKAY